ncbi:response regulator transcription factor (plasmid) [Kozakia baliensis]|uniref:response regulator transcription factor n=1 Tax=Kozakia baliensis TaxID=153496 RepID=UPI00345B92F7
MRQNKHVVFFGLNAKEFNEMKYFFKRCEIDLLLFNSMKDYESFLIEQNTPKIIVIDIDDDRGSRYSIAEFFIKRTKYPVIFISHKNSASDRVLALEDGAEDYMGRPVDYRELALRCEKILNRYFGETLVPEKKVDSYWLIKGLHVDYSKRSILDQYGHSVNLTESEWVILKILCENMNITISRERIISELHDENDFDIRVVNTAISRLRKKIESTLGVNIIRTVRGAGYMVVK